MLLLLLLSGGWEVLGAVVVVEVVVGQRKEQQRSIDTRALSLAWLPRCARFAPLLLLLLLLLLVVSGPPPPSSCGASCWASLSLVGHRARVSNSITTTTTTTTISLSRKGDISLGLDVGFGSEVGTISLSRTRWATPSRSAADAATKPTTRGTHSHEAARYS